MSIPTLRVIVAWGEGFYRISCSTGWFKEGLGKWAESNRWSAVVKLHRQLFSPYRQLF